MDDRYDTYSKFTFNVKDLFDILEKKETQQIVFNVFTQVTNESLH